MLLKNLALVVCAFFVFHTLAAFANARKSKVTGVEIGQNCHVVCEPYGQTINVNGEIPPIYRLANGDFVQAGILKSISADSIVLEFLQQSGGRVLINIPRDKVKRIEPEKK